MPPTGVIPLVANPLAELAVAPLVIVAGPDVVLVAAVEVDPVAAELLVAAPPVVPPPPLVPPPLVVPPPPLEAPPPVAPPPETPATGIKPVDPEVPTARLSPAGDVPTMLVELVRPPPMLLATMRAPVTPPVVLKFWIGLIDPGSGNAIARLDGVAASDGAFTRVCATLTTISPNSSGVASLPSVAMGT